MPLSIAFCILAGPTGESIASMYFDAEDELESDSSHSEAGTEAVLAWQTSLWRHSRPQSRKYTEEWVRPSSTLHTHTCPTHAGKRAAKH